MHKSCAMDSLAEKPTLHLHKQKPKSPGSKTGTWRPLWNIRTKGYLCRRHFPLTTQHTNLLTFVRHTSLILRTCLLQHYIRPGIANIFAARYHIYIITSAVGIATRYGLDGPGIESQWRREFPHPSRLTLGPTQPPIQWVPGLSRG